MSSPFSTLDFERFIYRQGQLLASNDFKDQGRMEAARRWMHNTALHNAWGVAVGYSYALSGSNQNIWNSGDTITIEPGIAYDCFGRELVLSAPEVLRRGFFEDANGRIRPEFVFETYYLVAHYQEPTRQKDKVPCVGTPNVGTLHVNVSWMKKEEVRLGPHVPLLIVAFSNVVSVQQFSGARVRARARPKMGSGSVLFSHIHAQPWNVTFPGTTRQVLIGFAIHIDTRESGFQTTPCYSAWLSGWSFFPLLRPLVSLADETPEGFTVHILFVSRPDVIERVSKVMNLREGALTSGAAFFPSLAASAKGDASLSLTDRSQFSICWFGIECECAEPSFLPPPPITEIG